MRTEDIIKTSEFDEDKVTGKLMSDPLWAWGNIYGDLDDQKDLANRLNTLDKEIESLSPEGMITDVQLNGESVVNNHIANVIVPTKEIKGEISNIKGDIKILSSKIDEFEPEIEKVKEEVEEELVPKFNKKVSAFWYDNSAVVSSDGKKYWYELNGIEMASLDPSVENYPSYDEVKDYLICKENDEGELVPIPFNFGAGGGGGGGGEDTTVKVNQVGWPQSIAYGTECKITINWSSFKEEERTGPGTLTCYVNDILIETVTGAQQGEYTFDITNYVAEGTNKVTVYAIDAYDNKARTVGSITTVDIKLTSSFNYLNVLSDTVKYTYTPIGNISKTVHFIVDGVDVAQDVVESSNEQQTHRFTGWTHGSHTLRVYFTCIISGAVVRSNELYYDLIYAKSGVKTPIIASEFLDFEQEQFNSFQIPYRVYTPGKNSSVISLLVDNIVQKTLTVDQSVQYWENRFEDVGTKRLSIKCESVEKVFTIDVKESDIPVTPVTQDLELALTTIGRSNSEAHPEIWEDNEHGISCTLSNFNFKSDGWVQDSDNNTVLRITGDARVDIPLEIFKNDFKVTGKTIELEFATSDVRDYEAIILSCFSGNRGIYLTPQLGVIRSSQSSLQTQYKEDDHVRLSFVVEKNTDNRIIYMYINGVMCGATQYPTSDVFRQLSPVSISLGSNEATLDIYSIRVYENNLNRKQVVNNWIADTQSGILKRTRYLHNNVYNESGEVVIDKLPSDVPYIIFDIDPLPQYKGDKRPGSVVYVDPEDDTRNFTSTKAQYNVQGTSSAGYPVKNIRIKYKNNKEWVGDFSWLDKDGNTISEFAITNPNGIGDNYFTYKVDFASSEGANNVELTRLYNDICVANNILTPPQIANSKVRVGIDGYPIISFWKDAEGNVSFNSKANFNNDKANESVYGFDGEWHDEKTKDYWVGDESWETTQNSAEEAVYKKPVTKETLGNAFEIRFPDEDGYSSIEKLGPLTEWVSSTYRAKATGETFEEPITYTYKDVVRAEDGTYSETTVTKTFDADTEEYRLIKFKAEFEDHFNKKSSLFYYLFTHLFLMVDSRAKNAFPTYFASRSAGDGGDRWFWLPYDMDTALGINNEGKLVFDYNLEDTDRVDGSDVFNGQDSVMWCNVRDAFDGEIGRMYSELRTSGSLLSYDSVEARFDAHQAKWPENIFNEDSYVKYVKVLAETKANYLEMLQGSKAEQRKWWLYNRFKYFDSKYLAGDSLDDRIQFRAYVDAGEDKPSITVTPYADIYATVSYANGAANVVSKRATRGTAVTLENPITRESKETDQETYIYSASQLKDIGDISVFRPDTVDVSKAIRLQALKVGDKDSSYKNPNLSSLALGANTLLKTLDVRNCTNLGNDEKGTQSVDVSGCTNIEEVYLDGTAIKGVNLPDGGILKVLHLPETITTLELKNQTSLADLTLAGTSNVTTLILENISHDIVDPLSIIKTMPSGAAVRVIGLTETVSSVQDIKDLYDLLDTMTGIDAQGNPVDKAQISGMITVPNISYSDWYELSQRYEDIEIKSPAIMCTVTFYNEDTEFNTQIVVRGTDAEDPGLPVKSSDEQYYYTFKEWDQSYKDVQTDLNISAVYDSATQTYTFKFDPQTTLVDPIPDETVEYRNLLAKPTDPYIEGATFNGWFKERETVNKFDFNIPVTGPFVPDENGKPLPIILYGKWTDDTTPVVDITIKDYANFNFTITDNIAVVGYAITTVNEEPVEFISITPTSSYAGSYTINNANTYYVWGKDAANHIGSAQVKSYSLSKIEAIGTSISFKSDNAILTNFSLQGRQVQTHVDLDEHYENLEIKVNDLVVDNDYTVEIEKDIVATTSCSPKSYTVKFDTGEHGDPVDDQIIVYQHLAQRPQNQYDSGYITKGWFKEKELINEWDFENDKVLNDTTLYAKWEVYIAPTKITVSTENAITLNFSQTVANGVSINWGDGTKEETSDIVGNVSLSHTYSGIDEAIIEITCNYGSHLLGRDINREAVMPAASVKAIEFAYNMPYTNIYAFKDCVSLTEIELTNYMTSVAIGAFEGCINVTALNIPSNITEIASNAFTGCSSLESISNIPDSIKSIGDYAFSDCSALKEVNIPESISVIPIGLFQNCTSLTSIDIPETVTTLNGNVFNGCTNLEKVIIRNSRLVTERYNFSGCSKITTAGPIGGDYNLEFAWEDEVPDYAFNTGVNKSNLKTVVLPETIERIGVSSFEMATSLKTINFPTALKEIGDRAFSFTYALTLPELPNSLEKIGDSTFYNSFGVSGTVNIPFNVQSIGTLCFYGCYAIRTVNLYATSSEVKADTYASSWFNRCTSTMVIHIPSSIDTDEKARLAYGQCWNFYGDGLELTYYNDLD